MQQELLNRNWLRFAESDRVTATLAGLLKYGVSVIQMEINQWRH